MTGSAPSQSAAGQWLGVYVETREILGEPVWTVTISSHGHDVRARLFAERAPAYAFALAWAEQLDLPLFDHHDQAAIT